MPSQFLRPLFTLTESQIAMTVLPRPLYLRVDDSFNLEFRGVPELRDLSAQDLSLVRFGGRREQLFPTEAYTWAWDDTSMVRLPTHCLRPGMLVPQFCRFDPPVTVTHLDLPRELVDEAEREGIHLMNPLPLSEALGRTVGRVYGDGWAGRTGNRFDALFFGNKRQEVSTAFLRDLADALCAPGSLLPQARWTNTEAPHGESVQWRVPSRALARLFDYFVGHLANTKHLPLWTLGAPADFRRGLIDGLLDTDGSVAVIENQEPDPLCSKHWNVSITTTAPFGAVQIVETLATDGVIARITASPQRAENGVPSDRAVRAMINFSHACIARRSLPLISNSDRLDRFRWLASFTGEPRISVPAFPSLYPLLQPFFSAAGLHRASVRNATSVYGAMARRTFDRLLPFLVNVQAPAMLEGWLQVGRDSRLDWHAVESVEPAPAEYEAILHSRRLGVGHSALRPVTLRWPVGPHMYKSRWGSVVSGVAEGR